MTEGPRLSRAVELVHREERRLPDVLHGELELPLLLRGGEVEAWGDNPVSSCRSYSRAKGLVLGRARFLWHFPIWRGSKGFSTGCQGVPQDPRDPLSYQPWWKQSSMRKRMSRKTVTMPYSIAMQCTWGVRHPIITLRCGSTA